MSPDTMYVREYQRLHSASTQPAYGGLRAEHAMVAVPHTLFIPYRSIRQENSQQPCIGRVSFRSQLKTRCLHNTYMFLHIIQHTINMNTFFLVHRAS